MQRLNGQNTIGIGKNRGIMRIPLFKISLKQIDFNRLIRSYIGISALIGK
jgi:hypothetical protein